MTDSRRIGRFRDDDARSRYLAAVRQRALRLAGPSDPDRHRDPLREHPRSGHRPDRRVTHRPDPRGGRRVSFLVPERRGPRRRPSGVRGRHDRRRGAEHADRERAHRSRYGGVARRRLRRARRARRARRRSLVRRVGRRSTRRAAPPSTSRASPRSIPSGRSGGPKEGSSSRSSPTAFSLRSASPTPPCTVCSAGSTTAPHPRSHCSTCPWPASAPFARSSRTRAASATKISGRSAPRRWCSSAQTAR